MSYSFSFASSARRRASHPDVPEDVEEALLHLNDPNWDTYSYSSATLSEVSFELEHKGHLHEQHGHHRYPSSVNIGPSLGSPSEFTETVSRVESRGDTDGSEAKLNVRGEDDYDDESPYAEVRAAVANTDDPTMPVNTFRAWFIGLIMTVIMSAMNQFFVMRYPSVYISSLVAQLLALPLGKGLERVLPTTKFTTLGYTWSFNPGPFNVKEHAVITAMANVVAGGTYATDIIATQRVYFNENWGFGYEILLCLSTQLIGFSFAGYVRQFLVWPASMIWPGALVSTTLLNTLHKTYNQPSSKHISRGRFFVYVFIGSFLWYWLPGYLFTALSVFNWVCWIAPNNVVVNQLFGYSTGLGMGFLTFDWSMIAFINSPLVIPWWAQVNTMAAFFFFFWFLTPILYYTNTFFAKFLPMSANLAFDNTGLPYEPSLIIADGKFDVESYKAYSPMFLPITVVVAYGIQFASITAVLVHTWLWYRHDIIRQFRCSLHEQRDVHSRLMAVYKEVPHYWYGILGIIAFVLSITVIEAWDTQLPVWALILALLLAMVFVIPIGIIQAITNQTTSLQVLAELIVGYMLPGRPVAMMIFKTFSFISLVQAVNFSADLKVGHYMKVPPRMMFSAQVIATVLSVFVSVLVQRWMFSNIPDFCSPDQVSRFTCPTTSVFALAAMVWGGVGPKRMFSPGALYNPILWFFLVGAILPIPLYYLARKRPTSFWRFVNVPVMLAGVGVIPPATGINFSAWFTVGAIFQYFMRRYHFRWWMRYNYILSAGLDTGVAIALIVIFFALQLPKNSTIFLNWWGNTVWMNTLDALGAPFITLQPGETFGPSEWS